MVGYATCTAPGATVEVALTRKFAGLELLRFLAAVAVLLWHYQHFFYNVPPGVSDAVRHRRAAAVLGAGPLLPVRSFRGSGVLVDFSGFIFFFRYGSAIHERRVSLREYIVFRVSRLYPLHVVTLVAVTLLQFAFMRVNGSGQPFVYQYFDVRHLVLNVMMISAMGFAAGLLIQWPGLERIGRGVLLHRLLLHRERACVHAPDAGHAVGVGVGTRGHSRPVAGVRGVPRALPARRRDLGSSSLGAGGGVVRRTHGRRGTARQRRSRGDLLVSPIPPCTLSCSWPLRTSC